MVARTAAALLALWLGAGEAPLEVEDATGARVALALGADERALVVHFWASWCLECAEELPALEQPERRMQEPSAPEQPARPMRELSEPKRPMRGWPAPEQLPAPQTQEPSARRQPHFLRTAA